MAKQVISKQADIQYRVELKAHRGIVIYKVLAHNGRDVYEVTLVNGKLNNCSCPARKPCYHMTGVAAKELAYQDRKQAEEQQTMHEFAAEIASERRHNAPLNGNREFRLMR